MSIHQFQHPQCFENAENINPLEISLSVDVQKDMTINECIEITQDDDPGKTSDIYSGSVVSSVVIKNNLARAGTKGRGNNLQKRNIREEVEPLIELEGNIVGYGKAIKHIKQEK